MAPHSSSLAWKIPWMEEPGRLQSMGSRRVRYDWATSLSLFTLMHGERNGNPLQCSCLENPRDWGAWWTAVYGVAQSWTRLKWLSSSSSSSICQNYLNMCSINSTPVTLMPHSLGVAAAAAAAKSLQSCPTLCNPVDGNPPGFPVPGILQARTLEWVAISFSNAWKWKVKVKLLSHVRPSATRKP